MEKPCYACLGDLQHGVYCPVCKILRKTPHVNPPEVCSVCGDPRAFDRADDAGWECPGCGSI